MSILIKGMNMPTKDGVITIRIWGNGLVERLESYHSWLLSGVRAQSIPPHGDLIDRGAFLENAPEIHQDYVDSDGYCWDSEWGYTRYQIENAPTIIPADPPIQHVRNTDEFGKSEQFKMRDQGK